MAHWFHDHDTQPATGPRTDLHIDIDHRRSHTHRSQPGGRPVPGRRHGGGGRRSLAGHGRGERARRGGRRQPPRLVTPVRLDHLDRPGHAVVLLRGRVRLGHLAALRRTSWGAAGRLDRHPAAPHGHPGRRPRRLLGHRTRRAALRSVGSASSRWVRSGRPSRCGSWRTTRSTPRWPRSPSGGSAPGPRLLVGGLIALFALGETARFAGIPLLPQLNWVIGWLGFQVAGFAWQDGRLPTGRRLTALAATFWALAVLAVTVGPWPAVMLHHGGLDHSPTHPPSTALILFGLAYSFTAAAMAPCGDPLARALAAGMAGDDRRERRGHVGLPLAHDRGGGSSPVSRTCSVWFRSSAGNDRVVEHQAAVPHGEPGGPDRHRAPSRTDRTPGVDERHDAVAVGHCVGAGDRSGAVRWREGVVEPAPRRARRGPRRHPVHLALPAVGSNRG